MPSHNVAALTAGICATPYVLPTVNDLHRKITLYPIATVSSSNAPISTRSESKDSQRLSHISFGWVRVIFASQLCQRYYFVNRKLSALLLLRHSIKPGIDFVH